MAGIIEVDRDLAGESAGASGLHHRPHRLCRSRVMFAGAGPAQALRIPAIRQPGSPEAENRSGVSVRAQTRGQEADRRAIFDLRPSHRKRCYATATREGEAGLSICSYKSAMENFGLEDHRGSPSHQYPYAGWPDQGLCQPSILQLLHLMKRRPRPASSRPGRAPAAGITPRSPCRCWSARHAHRGRFDWCGARYLNGCAWCVRRYAGGKRGPGGEAVPFGTA